MWKKAEWPARDPSGSDVDCPSEDKVHLRANERANLQCRNDEMIDEILCAGLKEMIITGDLRFDTYRYIRQKLRQSRFQF